LKLILLRRPIMKHFHAIHLVFLCVLALLPSHAAAESPLEVPAPAVEPVKSPSSTLRVVVSPHRAVIRPGLEVREPFTCSGEEEITLSGVLIDTEKDALVVKGNCRVFITRSHLRGGKHALRVIGEGDVTLRDTILEGDMSALHISGDGSVNASATVFRGRIIELGNGDLVGLGKNLYDD